VTLVFACLPALFPPVEHIFAATVYRAEGETLSAHLFDCNQFFATPQMTHSQNKLRLATIPRHDSTKRFPVVVDFPGVADEFTAQIAPGGRGCNSKDRQFANFRGQFFMSASVRYRYLAL